MLGKRLKALRNEKKIFQKKLASDLNLSQETISLYESNKREPDYETLNRIADYFDVSIDYLLGRTHIKETIDNYIDEKIPHLISEDITNYNKSNNNFINISTIVKLSLKNQKRIFEYIQMIKLLEDNNLDIEKEDKKR